MRAHLRIEKQPISEPGAFQIVHYDKIIAVAEDGTEIEISNCVFEWREISKVGKARRIEVVLGGYHVTQEDGSVTLVPEEET